MVTVMGKTRVDSKIRTCVLNDFSQPLLFLVSRYAILKVLIMIFVFFNSSVSSYCTFFNKPNQLLWQIAVQS